MTKILKLKNYCVKTILLLKSKENGRKKKVHRETFKFRTSIGARETEFRIRKTFAQNKKRLMRTGEGLYSGVAAFLIFTTPIVVTS